MSLEQPVAGVQSFNRRARLYAGSRLPDRSLTALGWSQNAGAFERLRNLTVINLRYGSNPSLADLATRGMDLRITVQERQVWITDGAATVEVEPAIMTTLGTG